MSEYYTASSFDWIPEELECLLHEDSLAALPEITATFEQHDTEVVATS